MDELKRSGQITRENLSQIQRRAGPAVTMEMDRLREQARLLEQKVGKALQKGSNIQVTQMTLSGASSLPVGRQILLESSLFESSMLNTSMQSSTILYCQDLCTVEASPLRPLCRIYEV